MNGVEIEKKEVAAGGWPEAVAQISLADAFPGEVPWYGGQFPRTGRTQPAWGLLVRPWDGAKCPRKRSSGP